MCSSDLVSKTVATLDNPLLQAWNTPPALPPFAQLQPAHFEPALTAAMQAHRDELAAIGGQAAAPTFDNTSEAAVGPEITAPLRSQRNPIGAVPLTDPAIVTVPPRGTTCETTLNAPICGGLIATLTITGELSA